MGMGHQVRWGFVTIGALVFYDMCLVKVPRFTICYGGNLLHAQKQGTQ